MNFNARHFDVNKNICERDEKRVFSDSNKSSFYIIDLCIKKTKKCIHKKNLINDMQLFIKTNLMIHTWIHTHTHTHIHTRRSRKRRKERKGK